MISKKTDTYYIDEQVVRLTGALTVIFTLIIVVTQWQLAAAFLAVDFAIRAFTHFPSVSVLIARFIQKRVGLKPKPVFAAPKKFAAVLGFVCSSAILVLLYCEQPVGACIVGGVLLLCAVLESAFKICLGCYVYHWIVTPLTRKAYSQPKEKENEHDHTKEYL